MALDGVEKILREFGPALAKKLGFLKPRRPTRMEKLVPGIGPLYKVTNRRVKRTIK